MVESKDSLNRASQRGAWLSIATYLILTAIKITVGWLTGSQAIAADGLNNATDVLGSISVLFALKVARLPADEDHRYGHERAEGVAALIVATIMGVVSLDVGRSAVASLLQPDRSAPALWGLWVALGAALVMLLLYVYNLNLARRCGSRALEAAAYDHRSDALTSIGAAVGILGAQFGLTWADPLAGLMVAVMIAHTAWGIGRDAAHMLMDGFQDTERIRDLRSMVKRVEGVSGVQHLRARLLGNNVAVDITVLVPCHMNVVEAHAVADRVEALLTTLKDVQEVHVHIEPDVRPQVG